MKRRSEKVARMAAAGAALAVVTAAGVAERTALAASLTVLAHLHSIWIPAAVGLESASMAAVADAIVAFLAAAQITDMPIAQSAAT